MAVIEENWKKIIASEKTLKILATTDSEGIPHIALKGSLHVEDDLLVCYDLLQASQTNKNLTHAIWFHKKVAISILGENYENLLIIGSPVKCVTAGKEFQQKYVELQETLGEKLDKVDLNAIWFIRPDKIRDNSYEARQKYQEENFPQLIHLDSILKEDI